MSKKNYSDILNMLDEQYGTNAICYLNYNKDYELLIATILSAQCTDDRVNKVTANLFKKYDSLEKFLEVDISELESDIFQTGFYRNKAKSIKEASRQLIHEFKSILPSDINQLTKIAGVGRKTANVVRTHIFNEPSIVVDTHVKRVSNRVGLTNMIDPVKIEFDLMKKIPVENWSRLNSQLIALGRTFCKAPKPKCEECFMKEICKKKGVMK